MANKRILFSLAGLGLIIPALLWAADETIALTTYYPSPFGSYGELSSRRLKVGVAYSDGSVSIPDNNLIVEGNVGIGTPGPDAKLHVVGDIIGAAQVFRAYITANFAKAAGWEQLPFNATTFNTLKGTFSITAHTFTPSRPGYYQVSVSGYSSSAGSGTERYAIGVRKNGVLEGLCGGNYSAVDTPMSGPTVIVYLNGTTDNVDIAMYSAIPAILGGGPTGGHVMLWHMSYLGA